MTDYEKQMIKIMMKIVIAIDNLSDDLNSIRNELKK